MAAVLSDMGTDVVKTGMLPTPEVCLINGLPPWLGWAALQGF
jgi:hypothetical protein